MPWSGTLDFRRPSLALTALLLVLLPVILPAYWLQVASLALILGIFATGMNLLMGFTGLDSLGQAAFYGSAGYVVAITTTTYGISWWLAAPLALVAAVALAAIFGLLAVRLRGLYFLLITVALSEVLWGGANVFGSLTGGANGLPGVPLPFAWLQSQYHFYYTILLIFVLVTIVSYVIVISPFGLALRAVKERETRSATLGYNTYLLKYAVFLIAAAISAVAGILAVAFNGVVSTDDISLDTSFKVMLAVIIGGSGTYAGPLLGAAVMTVLQYLLSSYLVNSWLIIAGCVYIAVTLWLPNGVMDGLNRAIGSISSRILPASRQHRPRGAGTPSEPTLAAGRATPVAAPADWSPHRSDMLVLDHVVKNFDDVRVIEGVDLRVRQGERVGIIGLNGAGKSTLFHLISGLEHPTLGRILLRGKEISREAPHKLSRMGISRTFQVTSIYRSLTVRENVILASLGGGRFARFQYKVWRPVSRVPALRSYVDSLLEALGLSAVSEVSAAELSYGHQRQVEIALALASEPSILLLDEPTAGLSELEMPHILRVLRGLTRDLTLVLVEHNLDFIFRLVDRVVVLHRGRIFKDGPSMAVREDAELKALYFGKGATTGGKIRQASL
jgi:ABC-type branched-subunit amino acid transport system ATPase component/ABC-type branched-subunit amino acid transport system permease subunit